MATISTTTLDVLGRLMVGVIEATVPVVEYERSKGWKHYVKAANTPSRTRRFRLVLQGGGLVSGGYHTNTSGDFEALLTVITDYAGQHENLQPVIAEDWLQIRDRLQALTANPTTGLIQIKTTTSPPSRIADTAQARSALSSASATDSNTIQVGLTYTAQYHRLTG